MLNVRRCGLVEFLELLWGSVKGFVYFTSRKSALKLTFINGNTVARYGISAYNTFKQWLDTNHFSKCLVNPKAKLGSLIITF